MPGRDRICSPRNIFEPIRYSARIFLVISNFTYENLACFHAKGARKKTSKRRESPPRRKKKAIFLKQKIFCDFFCKGIR